MTDIIITTASFYGVSWTRSLYSNAMPYYPQFENKETDTVICLGHTVGK